MIFVVIVITIILIYVLYKSQTDHYSVIPSALTVINNKTIGETYPYPACTNAMCITPDIKLKPYFKYNISNGRCVYNSNSNYVIDQSKLDDIVAYIGTPDPSLISCSDVVNTVNSFVSGRYIRLRRVDNTVMKLNHISVYDADNNNISIGKQIFTMPSGNSTVNTILNSSNTSIVFQTGISAYIQIDLGFNMDVSYVKIKHNVIADSASLTNAYLMVIEDIITPNPSDKGNIVFIKKLESISAKERVVYTYSLVPNPFPADINLGTPLNMDVFHTFNIPCTNCTDNNSNSFKNYKYTIGTNCYKAKNSIPSSRITDVYNGNMNEADIPIYFKTCDAMNIIDTTIFDAVFYMPFSDITFGPTRVYSSSICTVVFIKSAITAQNIPFVDNSIDGQRLLSNGTSKPSTRFRVTDATRSNVLSAYYLKATNSNYLFKLISYEPFTIQFYVKFSDVRVNDFGAVFSINTVSDGMLFCARDNWIVNNVMLNISAFFPNNFVWYKVCIFREMLNPSSLKLFVDDTFCTNMTFPANADMNIGGSNVCLGSNVDGLGFDGWISDFIFKRGVSTCNDLIT